MALIKNLFFSGKVRGGGLSLLCVAGEQGTGEAIAIMRVASQVNAELAGWRKRGCCWKWQQRRWQAKTRCAHLLLFHRTELHN